MAAAFAPQESQSCAAPEPAPSAWEVETKRTRDSEGSARVSIKPLGSGADVPGFLRFSEPLDFPPMGAPAAERAVADIWQAKAAYVAQRGPLPLQVWILVVSF